MSNIITKHTLRHSSWIIGLQITSAILALIITSFLSRTLDPAVFGTYRYFMVFIPLLMILRLPHIGTALTVHVAQHLNISLQDITLKYIRFGIWSSAVSLIISIYYITQGDLWLGFGFALIALCMPLYESFGLYKFYEQGKERFKYSALTQAATRIVSTLAIVTTAYLSTNPVVILASFLITPIFLQMFWFVYTVQTHKPHGPIKETWRYGSSLSWVGALQVFSNQVDKLLVWQLFGPEVLAFYIIVLTLPLEAARLLESVSTVLLPRISKHVHAYKALPFVGYMSTCMVALYSGCALYWWLAPHLFTIAFPRYIEFVGLSVVASLVVPIIFYNNMLMQLLIARQASRALLYVALVGIVCNVIGIWYVAEYYHWFLIIYVLIAKEIIQAVVQTILIIAYPQPTSEQID